MFCLLKLFPFTQCLKKKKERNVIRIRYGFSVFIINNKSQRINLLWQVNIIYPVKVISITDFTPTLFSVSTFSTFTVDWNPNEDHFSLFHNIIPHAEAAFAKISPIVLTQAYSAACLWLSKDSNIVVNTEGD